MTVDSTDNTSAASTSNATAAAAPPAVDFTLQILHYYGESGLLGVETAPIMGALIDKFDDEYANTLVLGEGDSYIPGPWLVAGADPSLSAVPAIGSTATGRPDIAIMNAFGTDASALGNHEFDLGSGVLSGAINASGAWQGALFPLITANLDFSADFSLTGLTDATIGGNAANAFAGKEASSIAGKIAPYAVVTEGGEKIGLVGATTWDLLTKTSPNGTVSKDDANPLTGDLEEVTAYLQNAIDQLKAMGVDKIVMLDQLDTLQRNKDLAPMLSGVDIMVAGGGHERLGDATDTPAAFNGHDADFIATDSYPIMTAGADGAPVLIVTTDTEYSYLGRLVVDFDANGEIITGNLDPVINGAYAATEASLQDAYDTTDSAEAIVASSSIGTTVKSIVDAIDTVITTKDGEVWGYTNVYLEGDRVFGRVQETNLGDISADANRAAAAAALDGQSFIVSLKNGGGLRSSIGSVDADGNKIPPAASSVKDDGAISTLDIENALRFDNKLMVFDTTPEGLLNILNYAASTSNGLTAQDGGYPQIGGVRFSYDVSNPAGARVESVGLYDETGTLIARVVEDGVVVDTAPALISVVILNFTANNGDGYPIKQNGDNFRFLLKDGTLSGPIDESLNFTAAQSATVPNGVDPAILGNALGEQQAFKSYLAANFATPATAFDVPDTAVGADERIQQLNARDDSVLAGETIIGNSTANHLSGTIGDDRIIAGNGDDVVGGDQGNDLINGGKGNDELRGGKGHDLLLGGAGDDEIDGNSGNDVLIGHDGNDILSGGAGSDTIIGGAGADNMDGGSGIDTLSYRGSDVAVRVKLALGSAAGGDAQGDTIAGFENVIGSRAGDRIDGDAGANTIMGGAGDDTLNGLGGDDTLLGQAGADDINGNGGNDRIDSGLGQDSLRGGSGSDIFVLSRSAASADTIFDFSTVDDQLEVSADLFGHGLVAGTLDETLFASNATGEAIDHNDRFIFNTTTGELRFDSNGSAEGGARLIATFAGTIPVLTAADFDIV